jgi:uncharacterized protein YlxW (UPF0749 family)
MSGDDRRAPDRETRSQAEVETPRRQADPVSASPDGPQAPATGAETADQTADAAASADPRAPDLASPAPAADEAPTARSVARKPSTAQRRGPDAASGAQTQNPAEDPRSEPEVDRGSHSPADQDRSGAGAPSSAAAGDLREPPDDPRVGPQREARPPAPRRAPEGADGDQATPETRPPAGPVGVGLSGVLPPPLAPPETGPGTGDQPSDVDLAGTGPRRSILARTLGGTPAGLLIGLLVGLLGFGLVVQLRSNTASNGLAAARQEDLVRILDDLSSREERLRRQIALLEAARNRLSTTGDRDAAALQEALSRSTALGILAGTLPAQGPGIELRMTDPTGRLRAEDMLDAVEELRAAGAEAIQVGSVRIGLDSAFTDSDEGLRVDGRALRSPHVVLAIGDPATLATALNIPGGVVDSTRAAGGEATITQQRQLVIRALRPLPGHDYARPADGGD